MTDFDRMREILVKTREQIGAERCSLFLRHRDKSYHNYYSDGVTFGFIFFEGEGCAGICAQSRKAVISNSAAQDPRSLSRYRDSTTNYQTENILSIPLVIRGVAVAVLQFINKAGGFNDADSEAVSSLLASRYFRQVVRRARANT